MSGLVAIYRDHPDPPSKPVFEEMTEQMAYRAIDGSGILCRETIRLGHQQLYTTPEEHGENQPLSKNGVAVAVDGRIDNRSDILPMLSLEKKQATDAELFLQMYLEYGVKCFSKFIGPFAVCIWDTQENRLILGRDKTGIRHLFYAKTDHGAVICSDMRPLTVHPDVRATVNADVAMSYLLRRQIPRETFYTDIQAVLPGEYVTISADEISTHRYWDLEQHEHELSATESLSETLYELLYDAIDCRLRGVNRPGLMLSGGVDSTTVAGIASTIRDDLYGYSVVFDEYPTGIGFDSPTVATEETQRINEAAETFSIDTVKITGNEYYPFSNDDLHEFTFGDNPCHTTTQTVNSVLFQHAATDSCRVLLTGHDAEYLRGTYLRIADLLKGRRIRKLVVELLNDDASLKMNLLDLGLYPLLADRFLPTYNPAKPETIPPTLSILEDGYDIPETLLTPTHRFDFETLGNTRFAEIFSTDINRYAKYAARRVALKHGIELRYPFSDARIFEFIIAAPAGELLRNGETYSLYNQILATILPQSIISQNPPDSTVSFEPMRHEGLRRNENEIRAVLNDLRTQAYLPLDQNAVTETIATLYSQLNTEETLGYEMEAPSLWPLLQLEYWLRSKT